jgi:lactoylglutathione lyase
MEVIVERLKITHVMLGVETTARALPFYRDVLGLTVQAEHPGFAFLDAGLFTLALSEGLARASAVRVGATELVFGVEDVTATYNDLREKGVQFISEPRAVAGPMFAANFMDPDGHRLSIFGPEHKA